jgi:hypothetical protein
LYVGELRNSSWSFGESIRLVGFLKCNVEGSGGGGKFGVSGTGKGFAGGGCRRRGVSLGKRSRRSGIPPTGCSFRVLLSVLEGIFEFVVSYEGDVNMTARP